ncbi:MAG: efflux RND transporter permease subunit [Pseudomonadota bacterium]
MNFSKLSIKSPLPAILLFVLLMICGLISFKRMAVQNTPDIDVSVVQVLAVLPGASPSQMESEVARKVENAVAAIPMVRHTNTTISDGALNLTIEFRSGKNVNEAIAEVRDALGRIRAELPPELHEPLVSKVSDAGVDAVLTYTLASSRLDAQELSWLVESSVAKQLLKLPGVGAVGRVGGASREVLIELDPARMAALNVSAAVLSQQLYRIQQESPSGKANIGGANQTVRTLATVHSVAEIAALDLALPDGRRVRLDQLARVSDGVAEPTSIVLQDGKPVVGFEVMRSAGASEITVAKAVRAAIAQMHLEQQGVQVHEALNKVDVVQQNYDGSMALLYEGALLTLIVVYLFLRDWRATLISAMALPLSVIPTFLVLDLLGYTLNMVTLLSLALVIGVLVDDAIVEIENIMRHLRMGKSPVQAALDAADEIGLAVIATTATLVAVFLPTAFLNDNVGQYFRQFGWTASVAVLCSLVVARLITPMMSAYLLKPDAKQKADHRLMAPYLRAVQWCLARRKLTMVLASVFFIGSLALTPFLQTAFIPAGDGSTTTITLELPPGSALADSAAAAERARQLIMQEKGVREVYSLVGDGSAARAVLSVGLPERGARERSQKQINAALRERLTDLAGARVNVVDGDAGDELTFQLSGEDPAALSAAVLNIQRETRSIAGLGRIYSNISLVRPELIITPDFASAAALGVTADGIGETLRVATAGDYDHALSKLNLPDRQVPIRVRLPEASRQDLALLGQLAVPGKNGNVPLSAVASLRIDSAPARIERRDRSRKVVIHVGLNGQDENEVMDKIKQLPGMRNLPASVKREKLGDAERIGELFSSFMLAILIGVLCIYMVLVLLFKKVMQPLTVMAALPLSIGGAFGALLVAGSSLSMPSLLGLLMLMGISGKNSILLVEYTIRVRRDRGLDRISALLDACHKRSQPIIMTSMAMGAGMLPIAIGFGADASFRAPMAIAVIGGLITSTVLSLLVIPVLYTYIDDLMLWSARRFGRRASATPLVGPAPQESFT